MIVYEMKIILDYLYILSIDDHLSGILSISSFSLKGPSSNHRKRPISSSSILAILHIYILPPGIIRESFCTKGGTLEFSTEGCKLKIAQNHLKSLFFPDIKFHLFLLSYFYWLPWLSLSSKSNIQPHEPRYATDFPAIFLVQINDTFYSGLSWAYLLGGKKSHGF